MESDNTKKSEGNPSCANCGGTEWKMRIEHPTEGDIRVYTCKKCGCEAIEIANE